MIDQSSRDFFKHLIITLKTAREREGGEGGEGGDGGEGGEGGGVLNTPLYIDHTKRTKSCKIS